MKWELWRLWRCFSHLLHSFPPLCLYTGSGLPSCALICQKLTHATPATLFQRCLATLLQSPAEAVRESITKHLSQARSTASPAPALPRYTFAPHSEPRYVRVATPLRHTLKPRYVRGRATPPLPRYMSAPHSEPRHGVAGARLDNGVGVRVHATARLSALACMPAFDLHSGQNAATVMLISDSHSHLNLKNSDPAFNMGM